VVWEQIDAWLQQPAPWGETVPTSIWFSGHSLGGALAVLAAARYQTLLRAQRDEQAQTVIKLRDQLQSARTAQQKTSLQQKIAAALVEMPDMGWTYTIGQPLPGDGALAQWINSELGDHYVRTINHRDVVTRVPAEFMAYAHTGKVLYFDSFGRLKINPSRFYRNVDAGLLTPDRLRQQLQETVQDHAASLYIQLLRGNAGKQQT